MEAFTELLIFGITVTMYAILLVNELMKRIKKDFGQISSLMSYVS